MGSFRVTKCDMTRLGHGEGYMSPANMFTSKLQSPPDSPWMMWDALEASEAEHHLVTIFACSPQAKAKARAEHGIVGAGSFHIAVVHTIE